MDDILKKISRQSDAEKLIKAIKLTEDYQDSSALDYTPARLYPGRNEITDLISNSNENGYYLSGHEGIEAYENSAQGKFLDMKNEITDLRNVPGVYEELKKLLRNGVK